MSSASACWRPAYIGLGANLGDPRDSLESACTSLGQLSDSRFIVRSGLYRSAPMGSIPQPDFLNAVAAILTRLAPRDLLLELQRIEHSAGRRRDGVRWGPRVLDLDLLVYSNETIRLPDLTVPHPGIPERNFVLLPLAELAPDLDVPGLGRIATLAVDNDVPRIQRIQ